MWRIIIVIFIGLLGATGCMNDPKTSDVPVKQLVAQKGGQVVYATLYEPETLNPLLSDMVSTNEVASLVYSGLVYLDDQGTWQPDLALEVPTVNNGGVSLDGKTVTYRLRKGVRWHDGQLFSARDVEFTWRLINQNPQGLRVSAGYRHIISVEALDQYTLVLRFNEYYPEFLSLFSRILPRHLLEGKDLSTAEINQAPIGTGPFQFTTWNRGDSIIFKANSRYHLGQPSLDKIVYKFVADMNSLLTQLKMRSIDVVGDLDLTLSEQAKALDGFKIITNPTLIWEHIALNQDLTILQDVRVRQALLAAVDHQAIVREARRGMGAITLIDQWPNSWAARPDLALPERNLSQARQLLAAAGWQPGADGIAVKNGERLSLTLVTTADNKQREITTRLLKEQLQAAGVELLIRPVTAPTLFTETLPYRKFALGLYAWYLGTDPDNSLLWHSRYIPGPANQYSGKNYGGWRNDAVDQLLYQAAQTPAVEARRQLYYQLQDLFMQDVPVIPLYFYSTFSVAQNNILNYKPNATPYGNLWNAWQWALAKN